MATNGGFSGWLRRLLGRDGRDAPGEGAAGSGSARADAGRAGQAREWALLESVGSPALGGLYEAMLRSAGIPVLAREWGGGSAVLGGVPVGVSLFVPRDRLEEARAVVAPDGTREGDEHEG